MKNIKKVLLGIFLLVGMSSSVQATAISTGNLANTTTAASPQTAEINATPVSSIQLDIGGAKYVNVATPLSVTITVNTSTPVVTVGQAANQTFRDDAVGAAFFGYYLTTGVRTANQSAPNVNIKVQVGTGVTANRSYYLLGNGTTTPTVQGSLTAAPAVATTFATAAPNGVHCGPSFAANGLAAIGCAGGTTVANMNITQFVKVLYTDPTTAAIVARLNFIAVNE